MRSEDWGFAGLRDPRAPRTTGQRTRINTIMQFTDEEFAEFERQLRAACSPINLALPTDKCAKLVRLLGSDNDGEVLAVIAALKRVLASVGLDLHDLAKRIVDPPGSRAGGSYYSSGWRREPKPQPEPERHPKPKPQAEAPMPRKPQEAPPAPQPEKGRLATPEEIEMIEFCWAKSHRLHYAGTLMKEECPFDRERRSRCQRRNATGCMRFLRALRSRRRNYRVSQRRTSARAGRRPRSGSSG